LPLAAATTVDDDDRLSRLEKLVDQLVTEVSGLKRRLDE
jgi:hypothetical protein